MKISKKLLVAVAAIAAGLSAAAQPYVTAEQMPDGVRYLPAPPDAPSVQFAADSVRYEWGKSMRSTPRGEQARTDANPLAENVARIFSVPFGMEISAQATPQIFRLLKRTVESVGFATDSAKSHYARRRPYVHFGEPTIAPEFEDELRENGSFPSGHSTIGWAAALVLAELNTERQTELLARGYEYGQSRVIAGYHYQSDVDAGRLTGAAAVARLHALPEFAAQMRKAKAEFAKKLRQLAISN